MRNEVEPQGNPSQRYSQRYPRKRTAVGLAPDWTTRLYRDVCDYMRGRTTAEGRHMPVLTALQAYFKHSALVAPVVPRSIGTPPDGLVLYRGVHFSPIVTHIPPVGSTVSSNAGCFTAFTLDKAVARGFAKHSGFVYRLDANRIARGTPWAWFTDTLEARNTKLRNSLASTIATEKEVLLPPGYFKVLSRFRVRDFLEPITIVDIAFVPQPEYVRRGAIPKLAANGVVTRTVRGNRLVLTEADNLANKVRRRRNAVVSAATKSLRRPTQ